nr:ribose 5-phosphate isomerase B [Bacteroidota bacterium]
MFDKESIIPIGSDHAGFDLKEYLIRELNILGYHLKDMGTFTDDSVDYPDYIHPVASGVDKGEFDMGIIICGSGQGANITANKYSNVRSALCWNIEQARLSRQHNNANIIALPGRFIQFEISLEAVMLFLNTGFEGGRHLRRVNKISKLLK